jgi:lauroyl/myristoyl acyltransferase
MSAPAPAGVELIPADGGPEARESRADRKAYWTLRTAEWIGMRLPRPLGLEAAELYFRMTFGRQEQQRAVVAGNLSTVLGLPPDDPLVQSAVRECFRLYGRYWYETFALRSMPAEEVHRRFTVEGLETIANAVQAGRGIVMALPHMGNWDAAGHWLCLKGFRMTAVAEELKPRSVYQLFLRHRRALGMGIVSLPPSGNVGSGVGQRLVRLLSENEVLTLVSDRDLTGRGVEVEMFGRRRRLPAGPAYLSLATGSPIATAAVYTTDEGWHCRIDPPIEIERTGDTRRDVTTMTRILAEGFERSIAAAPADWHMFQPAWDESEPDRERASPVSASASASSASA